MIDQGIFFRVIILLIRITYLFAVYGYCWEKMTPTSSSEAFSPFKCFDKNKFVLLSIFAL